MKRVYVLFVLDKQTGNYELTSVYTSLLQLTELLEMFTEITLRIDELTSNSIEPNIKSYFNLEEFMEMIKENEPI